MGFNTTARPGDHRTVTTAKWRHIFMSADTLAFTLSAGAATSWSVRNYYGTVVASGSGLSTAAATVLTVPTLPLGWYKLYLIRSVAIAAPWLTAGGELPFIVARTSVILPGRPGTSPTMWEDPVGEGIDGPTRGFVRMGIFRHSISTLGAGSAAEVTKCVTDVGLENSDWGTADTVRPLRQLANFPNGTGGTAPSGGDTAAIASAVTSLVAAGCSRFEARNEPNATTAIAADFIPEISPFATTVRANGGTVYGPCTIGVNGNPDSDGGGSARWLNNFWVASGGSYVDGISFHNYNGMDGGLPGARANLDQFVATLTKYGQQNKPRINTEAFSQFAAHFGSNEFRLQTQNTMLEMHLLEQYGVPKEQASIFYDRSHGFWEFPSFWVNNESDATLNPLAAIVRVWSDELAGKAYTARLDFGTVDNDSLLGSRFTAADGSAVLAIQTDSRAATVTLQVTGASSLTIVDPWGTTFTATVSSGLTTVTVDSLPVYVRLPSGVTAVPVVVSYGVDTIASRAQFVTSVLGTPTTFPGATKTYTFPTSTRVDRIMVTTPPTFQTVCGLLDFDVQALISGVWTTVGTKVVPTDTISWSSHRDSGGGFTDSFYSRARTFTFTLTTDVICTAVRVFARDVTYGGAATVEMSNGAGNQNLYGLLINGSPTGGTFTTVWNGQTSGTIAWNATTAAVQTTMRLLTGASTMTVTGSSFPAGQMTLDFKTAPSWRGLVVGTNSLTGGTTPTPGIGNAGFVTDDTRAGGQPGPKVLACDVRAFLVGDFDGGNATPGTSTIALQKV